MAAETLPEKELFKNVAPPGSFEGGMAEAERRGFLHVLLLHIGIRLKYLWKSRLLLKPIFCKDLSDYPSRFRPRGIPELDYLTCFTIRVLWIASTLLRGTPLLVYVCVKLGIMQFLNWIHSTLMSRIAQKMEKSGFDWSKARGIPVPEYDWENGNPKEFYETFVKTPHPVVLRGFLKGTEIMDYNFENMMSLFGDEDVLLANPEEQDGYKGKLRDVQNPKIYLHNSEILFNKYPAFWKMLKTDRLEPYMQKKSSFAQFFIGRGGTGAPFHNANGWNFFYMVDGVKRWHFVDPYDFYLAYPFYFSGLATALLLALYPDKYDENAMPAFKYCPYYVTELQPGDVLLNPAWWAHGIKNITDKSVGVATRWTTDGVVGNTLTTMEEDYNIQRVNSLVHQMGWASVRLLQSILATPVPKFDEHVTLRETKTTRFLSKQKELAEGRVKIGNWRPMF